MLKKPIPFFNNTVKFFRGLTQDINVFYITLSEGFVIGHTIREPICLALFKSNDEAEGVLLKSDWIKNGDRFVYKELE